MDSPSRKAWRIQEWRSSGFRAGPVARSHDYNNKSSKKNGDAILLYAQNLLHSLYKMGELRICGQELSVAIFGHNSQKCGSVRCRSGKSKGGGEQPLVAEPASLLLTFGDTPLLQHFSTQRLNSRASRELSCISRLHLMAIANPAPGPCGSTRTTSPSPMT